MMKRYAGFAALLAVIAAAVWFEGFRPETGKPATSQPSGNAGTGPQAEQQAIPAGHGFDFYVLSLSWSPTYCDNRDDGHNDRQCAAGAGHGFIVHGLWPQYERGYPEFCSGSEPQRVPEALGRGLFDIMPSMGLIGHQWRKHGSCSGLSQKEYFAVTRAAFEKITLPKALNAPSHSQAFSVDALENAFIAANPGLTRKAIAATCDRGRLEEIRICLTKNLDFRECEEVDRRGCSLRNITLPPAR